MKSQPSEPTILYIITQRNWGGAQRYVFDLATQISEHSQVLVGVGEPHGHNDLAQKSTATGLPIHQFHHLVRRVSPWHDVAAIFELKAAYQSLKPQIVHLNSSKAGIIGTLAGLLIPQAKRPKLVYTAHGWVFNEPLPWLVKKLYFYLEKWTARFKDAIIVTSPEEARIATDILKVPNNKVVYIPLGIEAPHFLDREQARSLILKKSLEANSQPSSDTNPWYVTIANAYRTKGLDILLTAIPLTATEAEYFIIGNGPEQTKLIGYAQNNHLTNVHFLGSISNAAELLQAFDGFILPSRKEGLPYVMLEALSAHLPIVSTRVGGIPSLAQKYSGITLINPGNSAELAGALKQFPNKKQLQAVPTLKEMAEKTKNLYKTISKEN